MLIGGICGWSGAIVDIPNNYALCDGNNGTPDLRDKFVIGAGGALSPGDTGGASSHGHTFIGDGHTHLAITTHNCPGSGGIEAASVDIDGKIAASAVSEGTTDSASSLPPYYALAKIMRIA